MTAAIQWGRFTDPAVERAFREQSWPEWSTRVRVVALAGAGLMACFAYTDRLALGPVPELYSVWLLRGVLLVAAVGVARLSLGPARPDVLDAAQMLAAWKERYAPAITRYKNMVEELKRAPTLDLAVLSVLLRELRALA